MDTKNFRIASFIVVFQVGLSGLAASPKPSEAEACKALSKKIQPQNPLELVNLYDDKLLDAVSGNTKANCSGMEKQKDPNCKPLGLKACSGKVRFKIEKGHFKVKKFLDKKFVGKSLHLLMPDSFEPGYNNFEIHTLSKLNFRFEISSPFQSTAGNLIPAQIQKLKDVRIINETQKVELNLTSNSTVVSDGSVQIDISPQVKKFLSNEQARYRLEASSDCFAVKRADYTQEIAVMSAPDPKAKQVAKIRIQGGPDSETTVNLMIGDKTWPIEPDYLQGDFGYSFDFGLSILDLKPGWYRISLCPHLAESWIRSGDKTIDLSDSILETRAPIAEVSGNIVITKQTPTHIEFRSENAADMNCTGEEIPSPTPGVIHKAPLYEFYDSNLRLKVTRAYPKGC